MGTSSALRIALAAVLVGALGACAAAPSGEVLPHDKATGSARRWRTSKLEIQENDTGTSVTGTTPPADPKHEPKPDPTPNDLPHQQVGNATATSGSGRLSRESIERTLDDAETSLGQCTEDYSTFAARIMIAPNGTVSEARVTQSKPDDPRMRDCLTEALRRMRFPSSTGTVPLAFSLAIEPY